MEVLRSFETSGNFHSIKNPHIQSDQNPLLFLILDYWNLRLFMFAYDFWSR
jgi:hypothetical protein